MTDAPDETTSPDATSDTGSEPRDDADREPIEEPTAPGVVGGAEADLTGRETASAAVPRPPRPGQRVPRRATAPSPRTAPAVVVAPSAPRVRPTTVVAPVGRSSAEDGDAIDASPSRPARVRRRTRVQRAAGSAEAAPAVEAGGKTEQGPPLPSGTGTEPSGTPSVDFEAETVQSEPDAVTQPGALLSPTDEVTPPIADADPADVEGQAEAEAGADDGDTAEPEPEAVPVPQPDAEPESHAEPEPEPEPEPEADGEPEPESVAGDVAAEDPAPASPSPVRPVTVRTDSLTAPRSPRPGLAGVAETALTPSVRTSRAAAPELGDDVLVIDGLTKRFDEKVAVDDIALTVRAGSFYGIVGPNGAGKTTTMSMVTGLLRPDAGTVTVNGNDVWRDPLTAKRSIGVLPDRLRLFDRLTGAQLLHYAGALRGLDGAEIRSRSADLVAAFGLEDAVGRLVTDYSAGMTKKVALACAMIHSPRMLVLDEPFESVDPVSAANVVEILQDYVAHGGTVVLSSHGMDFIQRICDHVAIIVNGRVLAAGTMDDVRAGRSLEERFVALAGGRRTAEGFSWLHSFSD